MYSFTMLDRFRKVSQNRIARGLSGCKAIAYGAVIRLTVTYGCETSNLIACAQKKLPFFEIRTLRRFLGPKKDLFTGRMRKRSNWVIRRLTEQQLITSVVNASDYDKRDMQRGCLQRGGFGRLWMDTRLALGLLEDHDSAGRITCQWMRVV